MSVEYILNRESKKLHVRIDGMTRESCNVDQIKYQQVFNAVPFADVDFFRCQRCLSVLPGVSHER